MWNLLMDIQLRHRDRLMGTASHHWLQHPVAAVGRLCGQQGHLQEGCHRTCCGRCSMEGLSTWPPEAGWLRLLLVEVAAHFSSVLSLVGISHAAVRELVRASPPTLAPTSA